ncbi:EthD domain-containing protein [Xylariaceae sp. FL0804]|nr:EthD domain-containing protein [Xylariaceae sp. FL0804]
MMQQSVLFFVYRKPGTTPQQFEKHYEDEPAGENFPLSHTRRYVHRTEGGQGTERNAHHPATVLRGEQADFDFDCCVEMTFADLDSLQAFKTRMAQPDVVERIEADEENFLDRSKLPIVLLGAVNVTAR